ncbi:MAG: hypothetical protein QOC55_2610 [Thermoleophilaceae bacterium]|nr:hypothetical protein [Thermoleophilaceae bacterium]
MFAGSFAPAGWAFCNGASMPISENDVLFTLLGTTYGGDGQESFNLPDLQGRAPLHMGQGTGLSNRTIGEQGGSETVTITSQTMPSHTHPMLGSGNPGTDKGASGKVYARGPAEAYAAEFDPSALNAAAMQLQGGSQPHENMQPYLCINYIISLFGIYPSQT